MNTTELCNKLNKKTKAEFLSEWRWFPTIDESTLFTTAKLLIPYTDDKEFCQAFDYLACRYGHQHHIEKLQASAKNIGDYDELFHDIRHDLKNAGHMLAENIRYGKRNENIDELLTKIVMLEKIMSSSRPNISISTDSPSRCNHCNQDCLASYRIMYGIVASVFECIKNEKQE